MKRLTTALLVGLLLALGLLTAGLLQLPFQSTAQQPAVTATVRETPAAGVAALHLEDQVWPKRCGHMKGKRVIPTVEQVQKIRAAVDARRGRDFFIVARTDARQVNGLEDAIHRCRQYKEAGADALFVEAPRTRDELALIAKELPAPLVANMLEGGVTPLLTKDELEQIGLQLIVCPLTALYASAKAMRDMFGMIKTAGTTREVLERLLPFQQFHDVIRLDEYYELDERYRSPEGDT